MKQALREINGMGGSFKPDPRKMKTGEDVLAHLDGLASHVRIIHDMLEERMIQADEIADPQIVAEPEPVEEPGREAKPGRDRMKRGGKNRSESGAND